MKTAAIAGFVLCVTTALFSPGALCVPVEFVEVDGTGPAATVKSASIHASVEGRNGNYRLVFDESVTLVGGSAFAPVDDAPSFVFAARADSKPSVLHVTTSRLASAHDGSGGITNTLTVSPALFSVLVVRKGNWQPLGEVSSTGLVGLVTRYTDTGICQDEATHLLTHRGGVTRLRTRSASVKEFLDRVSGTRQRVVVLGEMIVGPECEVFEVSQAESSPANAR